MQRRKRGAVVLCGMLTGLLLFAGALSGGPAVAKRLSGQTVTLTARVEAAGLSYVDGMVSADLSVISISDAQAEVTEREAKTLAVHCVCLPQCEQDDRITASFVLSLPAQDGSRFSGYADGIFADAEYQNGFVRLGAFHDLKSLFTRCRNTLSTSLRYYLRNDIGGVLAAMTVGDRRFLPKYIAAAYRHAGIPHVLVVSGLHVAMLCGLIPLGNPTRKQRVLRAVLNILTALLLMGITGFTPSVQRAGLAVILCNLGVIVFRPGDALTSLAVAGFFMSLQNGWTVCDISVQLSFSATLGVLAGAEVQRRLPRLPENSAWLPRMGRWLSKRLLPSFCAALCTFPVLVLQGMSVSAVSLLSNFLLLWLIRPILAFGFLTAFSGLLPGFDFIRRGAGLCGGLLVKLLNHAALRLGSLPGAQLHFETGYAVAVLAILAAFVWLARRFGCRPRRVLPVFCLLLALAVGLGTALNRDVIRVAVIGSTSVPAVVITQNGQATVLLRGGSYNAAKVREYLEKENISETELLIDLRTDTEDEPWLPAKQIHCPLQGEQGTLRSFAVSDILLEAYSCGSGAVVLADAGGYRVALVGGNSDLANPLRVDFLVGSVSDPGSILAENALCRSEAYSWLDSSRVKKVYYGQSGLCVCIRPKISYRIAGDTAYADYE